MTTSGHGAQPGFVRTPSFASAASLDGIFHPRSIAIVDAFAQSHATAEQTIAAVQKEFAGPVSIIRGVDWSRALPGKVDLAIAIAPSDIAPAVVETCVQHQIRGVVLLSSGFGTAPDRATAAQHMRRLLTNSRTRVLGPNCLGVINPRTGLNATPGLHMPVGGTVAFLGESPTLSRFVLDWSLKHIVGFSAFACLGSMLDVTWGDLIDHFGEDPFTRTIVVQISSIDDARSLISAAREVSLDKPVVAIKVGRNDRSVRAFTWPSRCVATDDAVLTAAFRRVGVLQVDSLEDLFYTADALSKQPRPEGPGLMIVSNSDAAGVIAADAALRVGVDVAEPALETRHRIKQLLPDDGCLEDVKGNGSPDTYVQAVEASAQDPNSDGLLVLLAPGTLSHPERTAESLLQITEQCTKPILLSYLGAADTAAAQENLARACIPTFSTPEAAARVFQYMWRYTYDLGALYETPVAHLSAHDVASRRAAHDTINAARTRGETTLSATDVAALLDSYDIRAGSHATQHSTFRARIGSAVNPQFGPILMFGAADRGANAYGDIAVGLPPLNATLARRMLEQSEFYRVLRRECEQFAIDQLESLMVRFSHLIAEQRWIKSLDIHALIATSSVSVDAGHCELYDRAVDEHHLPELAIRPYPTQYISSYTMKSGQAVTIRPIRAEDEPLMVKFHKQLSDRSVYMRYFSRLKLSTRTSHARLVRVCFLDYDREFALLAEQRDPQSGECNILAIATLSKVPHKDEGEVAVLISDSHQGQGLGKELIARLVAFAHDEGLQRVTASTMVENDSMCAVFRKLGFTLQTDHEEQLVNAELKVA
jgi:acetyltransferase